jgi:hypothetical protein
VLHARLVVHHLEVDDAAVPVRFATLVAVARAESAQLDWEVVAECLGGPGITHGRHRLELTCITGAEPDGSLRFADLSGDAIVVRVVDTTLVVRGDGPLEGLSLDLLGG